MVVHLIVAFLLTSGAAFAVSAPAQSWTPFHGFLGSWSGTRAASEGKVSVTRHYESVARNQHLFVTERVASENMPWGMVSFDEDRSTFVLRRFRTDGSVAELVLEGATQEPARLVFASATEHAPTQSERITHERRGSNEFVERVEVAANGNPMTVVSETIFRRKR